MASQSSTTISDFHPLRGLLYRCKNCPYFTKSLLSFNIHTKRHNSQPESFSCERNLTEIKIYLSKWYNTHISCSSNPKVKTEVTLKNYICKKCLFGTCCRYLSLKHQKICRPKKRRPGTLHVTIKEPFKKPDPLDKIQKIGKWFFCCNCSYISKSKAEVRNHRDVEHLHINWLKCTNCQFKTLNRPLLDDHVNRLHSPGGRWLLCIVCSFKTTYKSIYEEHIEQHESEWLNCSECKFRTQSPTALKKHKIKTQILGKCRQNEILAKMEFDCSKSILEIFNCKKCKFKTHFLAFFRQHMFECQKRYKAETNEVKFKLTKYKCEDCPFQTFSYFVLFRHKKRKCPKSESKILQYKCQKCNFTSISLMHFEMHMKNIHTQSITWYQCSHCQYKAKNQTDLAYHVDRNHAITMKWLQCDQCEYRTQFQINLYCHIKSKHMGVDK